MTGKQKQYLRALAHHLRPITQIGKEGMTQALVDDVLRYIDKHELMKVSILQSCPDSKADIEAAFAEYHLDVVQVMGSTLVLYKPSKTKKDPIILPEKK